MTVRELIKKLRTMPPSSEVRIGPVWPESKPINQVLTYSESDWVVLSPNQPLTNEQFHNAFLDAA